MRSNGEDGFDGFTRLLTLTAAERVIQNHLQEGKQNPGCFLLIQLIGRAYSDRSFQEAAFLIRQSVRSTDVAARAGEDCFLIFLLGCRSVSDAWTILKGVEKGLGQLGWEYRMGGLLTGFGRQDFGEQLKRALAALARAENEKCPAFFWENGEDCSFFEGNGKLRPIPPYTPDTKKADLDFIRRMMDGLDGPGELPDRIQIGLESLGRYFGAGQVSIVERMLDSRDYRITYEWNESPGLVQNDNLKKIPALIGDRYLQQLVPHQVMVFDRIQDLEWMNPIMAERQKLWGCRSLMQFALAEAGNGIGYLSVSDGKRERLWGEAEVVTFLMAGRILNACVQSIRFQKTKRLLTEYDHLTGVWNYTRFLAEGDRILCESAYPLAVVVLDIKSFQMMNQRYGYVKGDQILREISCLLGRFISGRECYARMEADRFVLLLEYQTLGGLNRRLDQLVGRLERIQFTERLDQPVNCRMGICLSEQQETELAVLVDHADAARKEYKDYHQSIYGYYEKESEEKRSREQRLAARMKDALKKHEFVVYYQPKVHVKSQKFIGFEALVRWNLDGERMIPPDEFIPLFEKNGFILELDLYVFEQVCSLLHTRMAAGKNPLPVAVNISRVHIAEPDFLERLTEITTRYEIPESLLELEITESAFLQNTEDILKTAGEIKRRGFVLTMDDFGTGYSSLSLLKELPVDIMKLDKTFFRQQMSRRERIVIANVIHLAKELNIQVISEGIETKEHEQFLREIGCELAQGYLYGRPAPFGTYGDAC